MDILSFDPKDYVFRIHSLEMRNFRNIEYSKLFFPNSDLENLKRGQSSVLGVYGQNGSGKTSVILALGLLKQLISNKNVSNKYANCIRYGYDRASLTFVFIMGIDTTRGPNRSSLETRTLSEISKGIKLEVTYSFDITYNESQNDQDEHSDKTLQIENEQLFIKALGENDDVTIPKQIFVDTSESACTGKLQAFGSRSKFKLFTQGNNDVQTDLYKTKAITKAQSRSFVFSEEFFLALTKAYCESEKSILLYIYIQTIILLYELLFNIKTNHDIETIEQHIRSIITIYYSSTKKDFDQNEIDSANGDRLLNLFWNSCIEFMKNLKNTFGLGDNIDTLTNLKFENIIAGEEYENSLFDNALSSVMDEIENRGLIKDYSQFYLLLDVLYTVSSSIRYRLYVVDTFSMGIINVNRNLPLILKRHRQNLLGTTENVYQTINLKMDGETQIETSIYVDVASSIDKLSQVVSTIIPGLTLQIVDKGLTLIENQEKQRIEILATRNGSSIPLRLESDGIRRLISILSPLIGIYNDSSMVLAVDEIDSGLFEYLLGTLLQIMSKDGKGQLLFTSHNLRPLEVLPAKSLVFTTTDTHDRYASIAKRGNSNLRDTYFKKLFPSKEAETTYKENIKHIFEL